MLKLIKNVTIYQDNNFYSSFPAIAKVDKDKLIAAFRRAPNYNGLPGIPANFRCHGDPNSQLLSVVSEDNGETWSSPRLVYAPPEGGCQDGALFSDGKYLFANTFVWKYVPNQTAAAMEASGDDEFLEDYMTRLVPFGTCVLRSEDQGKSWEGPYVPEPLPGNKEVLKGIPLRLHNRGNICRADDGRLILTGQILGHRPEFNSSIGVYESLDDGKSWQFLNVAADCKGIAIYEEPFLYITPKGKWVMLIRCHRGLEKKAFSQSQAPDNSVEGGKSESIPHDRARLYITESTDNGKSWSAPRDAGFHTEPAFAYRLPDERVLIVYGYRKPPFGVRARICDPELNDISTAKEYIIRDDAEVGDTGYPGVDALDNDRFLIIYYVNHPAYNGAAAIEGTIVEIKQK